MHYNYITMKLLFITFAAISITQNQARQRRLSASQDQKTAEDKSTIDGEEPAQMQYQVEGVEDKPHSTHDHAKGAVTMVAEPHQHGEYIEQLTTAFDEFQRNPSSSNLQSVIEQAQHINEGITQMKELIKLLERDIRLSRKKFEKLKDIRKRTQRTGQKEEIGGQSYIILELIGDGTYGNVYKVKKEGDDTGQFYAMKEFDFRQGKSCLGMFETEVAIMQSLLQEKVENAARIIGCATKDSKAYIVMEYHENKDLKSASWRMGLMGIGTKEELQYIVKVLRLKNVLRFLHMGNVGYHDFKLENILLSKDGKLFLTDFGLCHNYGERDTKGVKLQTTRDGEVDATGTYSTIAPWMQARAGSSLPDDQFVPSLASFDIAPILHTVIEMIAILCDENKVIVKSDSGKWKVEDKPNFVVKSAKETLGKKGKELYRARNALLVDALQNQHTFIGKLIRNLRKWIEFDMSTGETKKKVPQVYEGKDEQQIWMEFDKDMEKIIKAIQKVVGDL